MGRIRAWLISALVGNSSYMKNCVIRGTVILRKDHFVCGCYFQDGAKVICPETGGVYPEPKGTP